MRKINAVALLDMIQLSTGGQERNGKLSAVQGEVKSLFNEILRENQGKSQGIPEKFIDLMQQSPRELVREFENLSEKELLKFFSLLASDKEQLRELMKKEKLKTEGINNLQTNIALLQQLLFSEDKREQIPNTEEKLLSLPEAIVGSNTNKIREVLDYLEENIDLLKVKRQPVQANTYFRLEPDKKSPEMETEGIGRDNENSSGKSGESTGEVLKSTRRNREVLADITDKLAKKSPKINEGKLDKGHEIIRKLMALLSNENTEVEDGKPVISAEEKEILRKVLQKVVTGIKKGENISLSEKDIENLNTVQDSTLQKLQQLLATLAENVKDKHSNIIKTVLEKVEQQQPVKISENAYAAGEKSGTEGKSKNPQYLKQTSQDRLQQDLRIEADTKNKPLKETMKYRNTALSRENLADNPGSKRLIDTAMVDKLNSLNTEDEKIQFLQNTVTRRRDESNKFHYRFITDQANVDPGAEKQIETEKTGKNGFFRFAGEQVVEKEDSLQHRSASFNNNFSGNPDQNSNYQQTADDRSGLSTLNLNHTFEPLINTESGVKTPVLEQITQQLNSGIQQAKNEITIQLKPESLGRVDVRLKVDSGRVEAKFIVETQVVRSRLEHNLSALKSNLVRQGLDVENVSIETKPQQQTEGDGSNSRQQYYQEENQQKQDKDYNYQQENFPGNLPPEEIERIKNDSPALYNVLKFNARYGFMPVYYRGLNLLA